MVASRLQFHWKPNGVGFPLLANDERSHMMYVAADNTLEGWYEVT